MRLYKTELYKLCHQKIFPIGVICILAFVLLYFFQNLQAVTSTINGVEYRGYEAVRMDRRITEEFRGPVTDEKLQQIIDRYGFPQNFRENYGFTDGNFLNMFVMQHASDGYAHDWDDYKIATRVLPLAETDLGQSAAVTEGRFRLEYYIGWEDFTNMYYMEMILISVLILCAVSPVFSVEMQTRMKPLLFTTQEGPAKDMYAKIAASFTVSAILWLTFSAFDLLLYGMIYGWDGLHCIAGLVTDGRVSPFLIQDRPFGAYLIPASLLSLLGVLGLCAVTLSVSAHCRSSFHSIATAAVCWILPVFIFLFIRPGIYQVLISFARSHELSDGSLRVLSRILFLFDCLLYSAPFYLINEDLPVEISVMNNRSETGPFYVVIALACVICVLCIGKARRRYRKDPM